MTTKTKDPPTTPTGFCNPYEDFDYSQKHSRRVHTEVSEADYYLIKLIRPDMGTIKNVVSLLWKQLCYELRERSITTNTESKQFESFMSGFRIVPNDEYEQLVRLRNSAANDSNRPSSETNGGDVGGRTPSVPSGDTNKPRQQPNVPRKRSSKGGKGPGEGAQDGDGAGV